AVLAAKIDRGWHLYSKDLPPDSGIPTEMRVSSVDLDPIGDLQEIGHKTEEFSEAFGVLIVYYSDSVKFVQKFKLKDIDKTTSIAAEITFQVCNDLVCLAPNTIGFEKQLNAKDEPENSASTVIGNNPVLGSLEDGIKVASLDYKMPLVDCGIEQAAQDSGNGLVFILGLL